MAASIASHTWQKRLKQHDMIPSMLRGHNAPVERFFSSLRREWTGGRLCRTWQEAIADVREYVAVYCNAQRLHSKTPRDYEKDLDKVSGNS